MENRKAARSRASAAAAPILAPTLRASHQGDRVILGLIGRWTVQSSRSVEDVLAAEARRFPAKCAVTVDMAALDGIDTGGAYLLERGMARWRRNGHAVAVTGASDAATSLLQAVRAQASGPTARMDDPDRPGIVGDAVQTMANIGADTIALTGFLGNVTSAFAGTLIRPWRFRYVAFVHHLEHTGLRALPIVSLVCLLIGAVVMQQGAVQLRPYGGEIFSVNMLAILALREVGVLLTAVMIAGRSGSAYTAEIGAMKMREEIDAMRTLGLDPMETLVLPRLLALIVVLPFLTFIGSMMCLAGGGMAAVLTLGIDWGTYLERLREAVSLEHLFVGLVKTPVIAIIIGMVGCMEGLKVRGSAESLGERVTSSVVKAIFLVLVVDGLFAIALATLGF